MRHAGAIAGLLAALAFAAGAGVARAGEAPGRVVSMNVCTDQLALLVAAPGQVVSVSALAHDPAASMMTAEAAAIPANSGQAEDVFLLRSDLVLTGTFSTRSATVLLRRLGVEVAEFAPADSLSDIRANIVRMGDLLGRRARAAEVVAAFDAEVARVAAGVADAGPRATTWEANGFTRGRGTLEGEIVARAGFRNIAAELGYAGPVRLPLETLVMEAPDALIVSDRWRETPALALQVLDHPAIRRGLPDAHRVPAPGRLWACGTPHVTQALARLAAAATRIGGEVQR